MTPLLELRGLDTHYGDFQALHGIDLTVTEGETLAVIGANGAGKSTLLKTIAGLMPVTGGVLRYAGADISRRPTYRRVSDGIVLTPEGRRIFPSLTVEENLLVGAYRRRPGPWGLTEIYDTFPLVADRRARYGAHLSGGEQQATAIARALMSNPRLLLLDEVSLGLAPVVVAEIYAAMPAITQQGTTVLVVEQDLNQALRVADRIQCLLEGRTVLEGPCGRGHPRAGRRRLLRAGGPLMAWVNAVLQGVLLGGQYAMLACGLSLMFGVMRIVNLAHGTMAVAAAYLAYWLVDSLGLPTVLALVVTIPVFAAVGYALQRGLLNRALRMGELEPLLVTFGLSIALISVLQETFSADSRHLSAGSLETASLRITEDLSIGWFSLLVLLAAVGVIAGIELFLSRTAQGRAMRATSDDPDTARVMGIDNAHVYGLATAIAVATVALAGTVVGMSTLFTPGYGDLVLIFAFEAVIIGGLGSLWGTLAGAMVLGTAQTVGAQVDPAWGILAGHVVFLVVLLLRPQGLVAKVRAVA